MALSIFCVLFTYILCIVYAYFVYCLRTFSVLFTHILCTVYAYFVSCLHDKHQIKSKACHTVLYCAKYKKRISLIKL